MDKKSSGRSLAVSLVSLALLVGLCLGILFKGTGGGAKTPNEIYAAFLAGNPSNYELDGRLDLRVSMASDGSGAGSAIPVTVSLGFSDTVVDHSAKGLASMRLSVLDLSDGYDLENYAAYDGESNSFTTYSRAKTGSGEWGDWTAQDGYLLSLDSRALLRGAKFLDDEAEADNGTYFLAVRPDAVWEAVNLDELIRTVTGADEIDMTAYRAAMASSEARYEIDAGTGALTAVDADGFSMETSGGRVRASFRVELGGYGGSDGGDVAVPETVLASATYGSGVSAPLLQLPGGRTESVTGVTSEDVDRDSWEDQFSGDYGFDVVKYDDGTWHVLDMDGNEIECAEVYDDGSVYHPEYGRIYPDYETTDG